MDTFVLAMSMSHNVVTELSAAMMTRELTPAEKKLHDQACATMQGFFRLNEINVTEAADKRAEEVDSKLTQTKEG